MTPKMRPMMKEISATIIMNSGVTCIADPFLILFWAISEHSLQRALRNIFARQRIIPSQT